MKYKLRNEYTQNPEQALPEILIDRGVEDIYSFLAPSAACELNPYNLKNIQAGAEILLQHLRQDHSILFIVDCD